MDTIPMKIEIPVALFEDDLMKAIEMVLIREFGIVKLQDNKFKFWFDKGVCHIEVEPKPEGRGTTQEIYLKAFKAVNSGLPGNSTLNPIMGMNRPAMPGDLDPVPEKELMPMTDTANKLRDDLWEQRIVVRHADGTSSVLSSIEEDFDVTDHVSKL